MNYELYIGKIREIPENIEFSFIENGNYLLVFTNKKIDKKSFVKVPETLIEELSVAAKVWLAQSKVTVNSRAIEKNKEEYCGILKEFIETFENNLKLKVEERTRDERAQENTEK